MPEINISKEMYAQVTEFKHVVKAVIEEEVSSNDCVELILGQGINSMLDRPIRSSRSNHLA